MKLEILKFKKNKINGEVEFHFFYFEFLNKYQKYQKLKKEEEDKQQIVV